MVDENTTTDGVGDGDASGPYDRPPLSRGQRAAATARSWALTLLLAVALLALVAWLRGGPELPGGPPAFYATATSGEAVSLDTLRGRAAVVYFWATWCSACKLTTPQVNAFAAANPDVGVIAVTTDSRAEVDRWLGGETPPFPMITDGDAIAAAWQVRALPTIFVLDAEGQIRSSRSGVLIPGELWLRTR